MMSRTRGVSGGQLVYRDDSWFARLTTGEVVQFFQPSLDSGWYVHLDSPAVSGSATIRDLGPFPTLLEATVAVRDSGLKMMATIVLDADPQKVHLEVAS